MSIHLEIFVSCSPAHITINTSYVKINSGHNVKKKRKKQCSDIHTLWRISVVTAVTLRGLILAHTLLVTYGIALCESADIRSEGWGLCQKVCLSSGLYVHSRHTYRPLAFTSPLYQQSPASYSLAGTSDMPLSDTVVICGMPMQLKYHLYHMLAAMIWARVDPNSRLIYGKKPAASAVIPGSSVDFQVFHG